MATSSKTPSASVQRGTCPLCNKEVAQLPNGRLRYHSCHSDPGQRPAAEQLPQGYGVNADGTPTPRSEAILATSTQKEATSVAVATPNQAEELATEDISQEVPDSEAEAPQEIQVGGKTVEEANPSKPKSQKKAKEPKPKAEPKVSEAAQKARTERQEIAGRAKSITKINGKGDNARVTMHMYDLEADRTLCGAVVPAGEEEQRKQGWFTEAVSAEVAAKGTSCNTCEARMAKLLSDGPVRKRVNRKPGKAEVGTPVNKAKGDVTVVHLTNAASSDPVRTLCGAIIGPEDEGWTPNEDQGAVATCPTCVARETKLDKAD